MPKKLPRFLTPREVGAIFEAAKENQRDSLLLKCMYYLGLRNSEARCLRVDDIDPINMMVKVVQGKGKQDRYIPIPAQDLAEAFKAYVGKRREGYVFGDMEATISDRHVRRIAKLYAVKAGVRRAAEIHPHTLRHSYATFLHNGGVPLNEIQALLGHKNIETTTVYTHIGIENLKRSVERAFKGDVRRSRQLKDFIGEDISK